MHNLLFAMEIVINNINKIPIAIVNSAKVEVSCVQDALDLTVNCLIYYWYLNYGILQII